MLPVFINLLRRLYFMRASRESAAYHSLPKEGIFMDQSRAPIMEALENFKDMRIVPFDVPGHKRGRGSPELTKFLGQQCMTVDVNSMKPLDNLCHPTSVIREAEELADLTADNRIAELATTDNKMLAEVFADIDTGEIPFMLSGYTEDDYGNIVTALSEALHTKEPSSDPDAEIPAPAAPVTQYGDLWILGRHRVLCGDCTRPEDRALLLDGNKPEILLTDPPYCSGGSKESQKSTGSIGTERKNGKAPKIANDILSTRGYQNLIRGALTDIPCLYAYIFTDWRMWVYLFDLVEAAGFGVKSEIVWDKGTPGMGVGWRSQHELILFGAKAATHFDGHKGYGNVLSISRSGNELHPTQKPVELLEKLVDNTDFATGVYDPFGGSGTTLAACEAYGQPSYIMELTPAFTDVIVKRYIRITGKTTVRCVRQGRELPREEIAAIFEPDEEGGEQE